jgi:hypothetical protein
MKRTGRILATIQPQLKSRVIEFPQTSESNLHEQTIQTRLRDLTAFVADLTDSGFGALLAEETSTREAFDELRVKEAALRWIIRVARHSTGAVREKLWSDVEAAVSSLEKTAELLLRSGLVGPHFTSANQEHRLSPPERF